MMNLYERIIKKAPYGYAIYKFDLETNNETAAFTLIERNDAFIPLIEDELLNDYLDNVIDVMRASASFSFKWLYEKQDKWFHIHLYSPDVEHFIIEMMAIDDKDEVRNASLLKLMKTKYDSVENLLSHALDESLAITESEIGYIYYYDEDKKEFILNNWSSSVMDVCKVMEKETTYQLDATGLWGEAVRQRKPILVNNYSAPNSHKKKACLMDMPHYTVF